MRTTKDTLTGKPFRYNAVVIVENVRVPARYTTRSCVNLHPSRVPAKLLAELNLNCGG